MGTTNSKEFPVIGIGASAGGIEAFRVFFQNMPADCGMALVMVLHLPAGYKSLLSEILRHWTSMSVVDASDGTTIEPNHVYVPPPHTIVTLVKGRLRVEKPSEGADRGFRPIDGFFDSLGTALDEKAIGIVLSGTGTDGALGLKAIKERGGFTIAQGSDGTAPHYDGMPAGAIATGAVDLIASVEDIPGHLLRLRNSPGSFPDDNPEDTIEAARLAICTLLRTHLGHDFSGYRSQTFLRRVDRRMAVTNARTLDAYISKLKSDPKEVTLLFRDLLIRVTSFFRDQETFEVLAQKVIPHLFEGKMADAAVRVWVPGCATGEEAYSLAILLREHMDSMPAPPKVQIFATDIDDLGIATARLGRYPKTLVEGLSDERLKRFFTLTQGSYCVTKEIRDLCTFSVHNLTRDPPFSMMSLVSCRNLLIYMNTDLQARIIPVFHYSLVPGGMLLLGGSESVAKHAGLFDTVDKAARIYQRREGRSPEMDLRWNQIYATSQNGSGTHSNAQEARARSHGQPQKTPTSRGPDMSGHLAQNAQYAHLMAVLTPSSENIQQLQTALISVQEQFQSLTEEHQTALEELRSANEELHSVNEEMQSTNEELETSKEELQSLNEELHTVNLRLTEKIDELDHTNSDLRNLFDSTEIATVFLDQHLIVRSFTPAIATIYNLIPSDQGRRPLTDIVNQLRYQGIREDVAFVLSSLEPLERRVERADGSAHYIMRILPYREPDSTVSGALVTFVDVTSIVQAEEALVAADVRKDVFLATLSHELRNPLAPIRMAAQVLQLSNLPPDQLQEARNVIARQVAHMSSLLDDLLDVARITRGSFLLKKAYVDLEVMMNEAVEEAHSEIEARQHTLRVEYPSIPIRLEVDPVRITQVMANLLINAAKYTPTGGLIYLGSRIEGQHLIVSVRDNGIGLSAEAMTKVFDMFTRVDSEAGRTVGGLGIGLALAKGFVELHGGRIDVRSAGENQGCEFRIVLPRALIVPEAETATKGDEDSVLPVAPRRILVADDNRDSADTTAMFLRLSGHEVHTASTGTEALEVARRVRPDVGVIDIGMPKMNGYEVAEQIRNEAWGQQVILIALTGWGQDSDKRRAVAAGFNHHLTKPVDPEMLEGLFHPGGLPSS